MKYFSFTCALCLIGFLFLASCGEDAFATTVELEQPEVDDKIVVNAFVEDTPEDNILRVYVGRNLGLLEDGGSFWDEKDLYSLNDAVVSVENKSQSTLLDLMYLPDSEFANFGIEDFNYVNTIPADFLRAGDTYVFNVEHPDYENSHSEITYPNVTKIQSFEYEFEGGVTEEGDDASKITISFQDEPGITNYYELSVTVLDTLFGDFELREIYSYTSDLSHSRGVNYEALLLTDDSFDGELKTLEVKIDQFYAEFSTDIYLKLKSVNEGYYKYSKTLEQYRENDGNPFVSPVQIATNVDNGLGVIALKSTDVIQVK